MSAGLRSATVALLLFLAALPGLHDSASAGQTYGDVSCDGEVDSIDGALLLQQAAGLLPAVPCPENGDVNGDGRADPLDAALILQHSAGLIDNLTPPFGLQPAITTLTVELPTTDIVYDPFADRIYASVPPGSSPYASKIAVIDPSDGAIERSVSVGPEPTALALSPDGQFLYAGLEGDRSVRRIDRATLSPGPTFELGTRDFLDAEVNLVADWIAVLPDDPHALVVVRRALLFDALDVAVYDNGVPRPETVEAVEHAGLELGGTPSTLYAASDALYVIAIDETGLNVVSSAEWLETHRGITYAGGRLYDSEGQVVEAPSLRYLGRDSLVAENSARYGRSVVDSQLGRVFYLREDHSGADLLAFDEQSFQLLGTAPVDDLDEDVQDFIRLGGDAFAATADNRLTILRARLAREDVPSVRIDPAALSFESRPIGSASPTETVTVTNEGPTAATVGDVGTVADEAGDFLIVANGCSRERLEPGASCTIDLRFSPTANGARRTSLDVPHDGIGLPRKVSLAGVGGTFGDDTVRLIQLDLQDVVYDPVSDRIYASSPGSNGRLGNSLLRVDPGSGVIEGSSWVGSEPRDLAIAHGGALIYAAIHGAATVQRYDAVLGARDGDPFRLGDDERWGPEYVGDLAVSPNDPNTIAAVVFSKGISGHDVVIYDNGVRLPSFLEHATVQYVEFGSAEDLYGVDHDGTFTRASVDDTGTVLRDRTFFLLESTNEFGLDIESSDGLLYVTSGQVFDPEALTEVAHYPASGLVERDASLDRTFFVDQGFPNATDTRTLRAFDSTLSEVGAISLENVEGFPYRLIRLADDGLALFTTAGELFIFHTDLARIDGPVLDLDRTAVDFVHHLLGTTSSLETVTIRNHGISELHIEELSIGGPNAEEFSLVDDACTLGPVDPGAGCEVSLTFSPSAIGRRDAELVVQHDALGGSHSVQLTGVGTSLIGQDEARTLPLRANDIVYDGVHGLVLASIPDDSGALSNSVAAIDPTTGNVSWHVTLDSEPTVLEVSDGAEYVYVAIDTAFNVARIDTATRAVDVKIELGVTPDEGDPYYVLDLDAVPGQPGTIAIARGVYFASTMSGRPIIYDGATPRPVATAIGASTVFANDPNKLYGSTPFSGVVINTVSADGVAWVDHQNDRLPFSGSGLESDGGIIYSSSGGAIDPLSLEGGMYFSQGPVAPDAENGKVFFLTTSFVVTGGEVEAFAIGSYMAPIGTILLPPEASGGTRRLIRWGADGLALLSGESNLVLLRSSEVTD